MQILSSESSIKCFNAENLYILDHNVFSEGDINNVPSDIKHRLFPRPFERLALPQLENGPPVGCEIGICFRCHPKVYSIT